MIGTVAVAALAIAGAGCGKKNDAPAAANAPAAAKAGSVLSVGIRLKASGAAIGTHVFNVRFVPPSGECRFHFRRNVAAKGGVAHVDFPLALNDEKGDWKIVAEDSFTGLRAEHSLKVIE